MATPTLQLGAMNFGGRTPEAEAKKIIHRALDLGVSLIDTANAYNQGESERIVGRALGTARDRVRIATKVGFGSNRGKPEGLSAKVIAKALEDSLQRLGTDYVDVYYLHTPDPHTPIEETLEALSLAIGRGLVRGWAVSNYASWQILEMLQLAPKYDLPAPVLSQQIYNLLIRQLDVEYGRFAAKYALATCVYNPLAAGLLTGKHTRGEIAKGSRFDKNPFYQRRYLYDVSFEHVKALGELATENGMSLIDLSYAWLTHRDVVSEVIVGPGSVAHLEAAHAGLQKRLEPEVLARIDALSVAFRGTDLYYAR